MITIDDAREHLRLDSDSSGGPDDAWLNVFIPAIEQAVELWLGDAWRCYVPLRDSYGNTVNDSDGNPIPQTDSNGDLVAQPVVRAACLLELERKYRARSGEPDAGGLQVAYGYAFGEAAGYGYVLGVGATSLLAPLRRSRLA